MHSWIQVKLCQVLLVCVWKLSAILADQLWIPFYITHCRMCVHGRHIDSERVTDHPIFHIVADDVFDLCFNLLLPSLITFAVLCMPPKSCLL